MSVGRKDQPDASAARATIEQAKRLWLMLQKTMRLTRSRTAVIVPLAKVDVQSLYTRLVVMIVDARS
jgi:hypothetical protein